MINAVVSISQSAAKVILQKFRTHTPTRTHTLDPHPHNSTRYPQPATFSQTRATSIYRRIFRDFIVYILLH